MSQLIRIYVEEHKRGESGDQIDAPNFLEQRDALSAATVAFVARSILTLWARSSSSRIAGS